jgi:hypothetical protein
MSECPECRVIAYEPGWYKGLRDERVGTGGPERVLVPDMEGPDVEGAVAEVPVRPDVEVPDLETAERDER